MMSRDAFAGLFVALLGGGILLLTWRYPSGTMSDIGPGMVLQLAGIVMLLLGVGMAFMAFRASQADTESILPRNLRPFIILAGMAVFGLALESVGLVLTGFLSTFLATWGSPSMTLRGRIVCAAILTVFVTLLFGYGLRLQIPIWPRWFLA
ncbi:tripartite tricarboxylate transporter TctB family protein [Ferrovibrio sp.]|uniref:tripartite tricarboxylate transporter TctB family protein n=1 Tax=Ferrovibrio sp. TaxID=1917215 RepID=UPI0035B3360F